MEIQTVMVNGIKVYPFETEEQLIDYVANKPAILVALNAGKLGRSTPKLKSIINDNIGYCDGIGATIELRKKGFKRPTITGCDIWIRIVDRLVNERSFYFIGGTQEVIEKVIQRIKKEYPQINIKGYRNGFIKTDEDKFSLLKDIEEKKPEVVFVAMGSPKQENLMTDMQKINPYAIYQGLGGSFDIYSGLKERAPLSIRRMHLEGIYRGLSRLNEKNNRERFFSDIFFVLRVVLGFVK